MHSERIKTAVIGFTKKNVVMLVALVVAIVTAFFVPPDDAYPGYFDFKTLSCLFCTLAVVCALKNVDFFYALAYRIVRIFKNAKAAVLALVYVTFLGSMLIANDMALLTFLPLGYLVLTTTGKKKYMAFTFIMQNIAANLGGMLTPFGNPQNLYLYTKFNIATPEFMSIMFPPFLLSVALITACCLIFVKAEPLEIEERSFSLPPFKTTAYLILFALSIVMVFRLVPFYIGLAVVFVALVFLDRKALLSVDYPLLFTFAFFFVIAGNVARIGAISEFLSSLINSNVLLYSTLSCQVISNVPSAVLLSGFTSNYRELLLGVNIGGVGTLIASLASLITLREYLKENSGEAMSYVLKFSAFNFFFLGVLLSFCLFVV